MTQRATREIPVRTSRHRGFSLIDVLVSISVIAVLIAILTPSLYQVQRLADRIVCASNVRQSMLGIQMHADDHDDRLPPSISLQPGTTQSVWKLDEMMVAKRADSPTRWDGLGWLYRLEYLGVPDVFYCPSHTGDHPITRYRDAWKSDSGQDVIAINFHYRGAGPAQHDRRVLTQRLSQIAPGHAIVSDGLRTKADFNHKTGANVLRSDLSVSWFPDSEGLLNEVLPDSERDMSASEKVLDAWTILDSGDGLSREAGATGPGGGRAGLTFFLR